MKELKDCKSFPINSIDAEDIPTWAQTKLPDEGYLLMAAKLKDQHCGRPLPFLYHLPINKITPGATFQPNTYSVAGNGYQGEWAANQVRAGYTYNNTPNDIRLADITAQKAQYILLSKDNTIEGNYLIQGSGFYTFTGGHNYVPGYAYYLGTEGQPTTDSSFVNGIRQHLFEVIDSSTILINIYSEQE